MLVCIQNLFIERLQEWSALMAPSGWQRQTRWEQRGYMTLIYMALKRNAVTRRHTRYARRRAVRQIGARLITLARHEVSRRVGEQWRDERHERKRVARGKLRRVLWDICRGETKARVHRVIGEMGMVHVGAVERWVDRVHYVEESGIREHRAMTIELGPRILHATKCMVAYVRLAMHPVIREKEREEMRCAKIRMAKWRICALLVRSYRQSVQQGVLDARALSRAGLVCANTRYIGRIMPKGGVVYDETRRNRARIQASEVYNMKRWPRRDKCGPALTRLLYYLWDIT